ncbi:unnamed protein product [Protopolystoma xenopodis]|uniref:Uncharacterized protein n=1 Tax=Protopolystoma xenopodis TaxID=117903 RepID=A0A3S5AL43_9PLAT|nr:unnamed protein product [Protopolystoma xenopodis]
MLGTVAKPLGGVLDLVSGAMTSLREAARPSAQGRPRRRRPRRAGLSWAGAGGLEMVSSSTGRYNDHIKRSNTAVHVDGGTGGGEGVDKNVGAPTVRGHQGDIQITGRGPIHLIGVDCINQLRSSVNIATSDTNETEDDGDEENEEDDEGENTTDYDDTDGEETNDAFIGTSEVWGVAPGVTPVAQLPIYLPSQAVGQLQLRRICAGLPNVMRQQPPGPSGVSGKFFVLLAGFQGYQ